MKATREVEAIQFGLLTSEAVEALSVVEVKHPHATEYPPEGYNDLRMGTPSADQPCLTCHNDLNACPAHLGMMIFGPRECPLPFVNPFFAKALLKYCEAFCLQCGVLHFPVTVKVCEILLGMPPRKRLRHILKRLIPSDLMYCGQVVRKKERKIEEKKRIVELQKEEKRVAAETRKRQKEEKKKAALLAAEEERRRAKMREDDDEEGEGEEGEEGEEDEGEDELLSQESSADEGAESAEDEGRESEEEEEEGEEEEEEEEEQEVAKHDEENDLSSSEDDQKGDEDEDAEPKEEEEGENNNDPEYVEEEQNEEDEETKAKLKKRARSKKLKIVELFLNKRPKANRMTKSRIAKQEFAKRLFQFKYNEQDWKDGKGCGAPRAHFDGQAHSVYTAIFILPLEGSCSKKEWPQYSPWILYRALSALDPWKLELLGLDAFKSPLRAFCTPKLPILPPVMRRVREETLQNSANAANNSTASVGAESTKKSKNNGGSTQLQDKMSLAYKELITKNRRMTIKLVEDNKLLQQQHFASKRIKPKEEKGNHLDRKHSLENFDEKSFVVQPDFFSKDLFRKVIWHIPATGKEVCSCLGARACICGKEARFIECKCCNPDFCECLGQNAISTIDEPRIVQRIEPFREESDSKRVKKSWTVNLLEIDRAYSLYSIGDVSKRGSAKSETVSPWAGTQNARNNATQREGSVSNKFVGKQGFTRKNMYGKRGNKTVRAVVGPDNHQHIGHVSMPLDLAESITYREILRKHNYAFLVDQLRNGQIHYITEVLDDEEQMRHTKFLNQELVGLRLGMGLDRSLKQGDLATVNRQPTLHKPSMQAMRIGPPTKTHTHRINEATTGPFGADHDGDEINLWIAICALARAEFLIVNNCFLQFKSQLGNGVIFTLIQNSVIAAFYFSLLKNVKISKQRFWYYVACMGEVSDDPVISHYFNSSLSRPLPPPTWIEDGQEYWSHRQLFAFLLPPNFNYKSMHENGISIKNGVWLESDPGICSSLEFSKGSTNLLYVMAFFYGPQWTLAWMTGIQRVFDAWTADRGVSIGLYDYFPLGLEYHVNEFRPYKNKVFAIAEKESLKYRSYDIKRKGESDPHIGAVQEKIIGDLGRICCEFVYESRFLLDMKAAEQIDQEAIVQGGLFPTPRNYTNDLTRAGTKVKPHSHAHFASMLGQQHSNNQRIPQAVSYFNGPSKHSLKAYGFIEGCYFDGLDACSQFSATVAARETMSNSTGLIPLTGYFQRELGMNLNNIVIKHDGTVRSNNCEEIIQIRYGSDGYNPSELVSQPALFLTPDQFCKPNLVHHKKQLLIYEKQANGGKAVTKRFAPIYWAKLIEFAKTLTYGPLIPLEIRNIEETQVEEAIYCQWYLQWRQSLHADNILFLHKDLRFNFMQETLLLDALSPWNILTNHKLNKKQIAYLFWRARHYLQKALVPAGEAVGAVTSQSIGEGQLQAGLKQFHFAGLIQEGNVVSALIETVQYRKKAIGNMDVYLKPPFNFDSQCASWLAGELVERKLKYFLCSKENYLSVKQVPFVDQEWLQTAMIMAPYETRQRFRVGPLTILRFDKAKCQSYRLELVEICNNIIRQSKFKEGHMLSSGSFNEPNYAIAFTLNHAAMEHATKKLGHAHFFNPAVGLAAVEAAITSRLQLQIRGIAKITHAIVQKDPKTFELVIYTVGSNLNALLQLPFVDFERTTTTFGADIYNNLGIVAMRDWLMKRLSALLPTCAPHIPKLIADHMTFTGDVTPENRIGLKKRTSSPLHTTFEDPLDNMRKISIFAERDPLVDVSAAILFGQKAPVGTGTVCARSVQNSLEKSLEWKTVAVSKPELQQVLDGTWVCPTQRTVPCKARTFQYFQQFVPVLRNGQFICPDHNRAGPAVFIEPREPPLAPPLAPAPLERALPAKLGARCLVQLESPARCSVTLC